MQKAFETLDYFPSFAQFLEINSTLTDPSTGKISFGICNECDGFGVTMMRLEPEGGLSAFACSSCANGKAQYLKAKGQKHGTSDVKFFFPFSSEGRRRGYISLREERDNYEKRRAG